jgi:hypothetical protein
VAEECSIKNSVILSESIYLGPGSKISCDNDNFPTRIICDSGTLDNVSINSPDNTILDGKFSVLSKSIIGCTGVGDFVFNDSQISTDGYFVGNTLLISGSKNNGKIFGANIIFSGSNTVNLGLVSGNCLFISGAINSGNISGSATFSGSGSINYGFINNEAYFYNGSINEGNIKALSFFYDSENKGNLYNGANFYNSINSKGIIKSGIILFNNSQNSTTVYGSIVNFISGSKNNSNGVVYSNNVSFDSGINAGNIYADLGTVVFKNNSFTQNFGLCRAKNIYFKDVSYNIDTAKLDSVSGSSFDFLDRSNNYGNINIITENTQLNFRGYAANNGILSVSGKDSSINFYDNARNFSNINFVNFYDKSINSGTITTGLFYKTSTNAQFGIDLYFCDQSINASGDHIPLTGTFRDSSRNSGSVESAFFLNKSQNIPPSSLSLSIQSGIFFDSAKNEEYARFTSRLSFYNNSLNLATNTVDHFFYHRSVNNGKCSGIAQFSNSSRNRNYVSNGTFFNNSINEKSGSGQILSFRDSSQNNGYSIYSVFSGNSINGPTAYSSYAIFIGNSTNNSSFSVTNRPTLSGIDLYKDYPNIIFSGNSKNIGNIVESIVSFGANASNLGSIRFGTNYTFNENRILKKELLNNKIVSVPLGGNGGNISSDTYDFLNIFYGCNGFQWPTLSFRNNSKNSGNLAGYFKYYFYDSSENYASVSSLPVVPELHDVADFQGTNINSAPCKNFGTIPGKSSFISCINSGTVQYPSFSSSINYGNMIGETTNDININILCKQTISGFNKISFIHSKNYGNAKIDCNFTYSSNYGNIAKNATLNNSTNFGFIGGDAIFSNSYNYGDIGSNASFFNSPCACCNIRGTAKFDYYSDYYSYSYLSNLVSMPYDPLAPYTLEFIKNNLLTHNPNNSIEQILASLKFKGQNISKSAEFINFSNNYGGLLSEDAYFSDTSKNRGTIQGNAIFTKSSQNYGNISKDAIFSIESNNYFADIGGNAVFPESCYNIFGNIGKNGTFTNTINRGNIGESGFFFSSTHYGNIGKGAIFDDSVFMVGTAQNVEFLNRSINEKYGHIKVNAVFDNLSENRGHIGGNALFSNDSSNIAVRQSFFGTFIGYSPAGYVEGDAIFLSGPEAIRNSNGSTTSDNYGVIGGSATFDSSIADNCGYVFGPILSDTNIGCSSFYSMNRQEALDIIDTYNSLEYRNIVENWEERAGQSMQ